MQPKRSPDPVPDGRAFCHVFWLPQFRRARTFGDEPPLEVGDCPEDMEHQLAGGRRRINAFLEARSCVQRPCAPFGRGPVAACLRKFVARLHPHPVTRGAPADIFQSQRHVCRHARLAVQQARQVSRARTRDAQPSRLRSSLHRSMLSRMSSPRCGRVLHWTDAIARNVVHGQYPTSVSDSRSGPRPRPRPSSKRKTTRQFPETRTLH